MGNEPDILSHLKKGIPVGFDPAKPGCVFNWLHVGEDTISGKEPMYDIRMKDTGFSNWFQMDRADFISVNLGKDLPVEGKIISMNITESFKNKTLVITGGTGSFATA